MENKNKDNVVHIKPVVVAEHNGDGQLKEFKTQKPPKTTKQKAVIWGVIIVMIALMGYAQIKIGIRTEMKIVKIHDSEGSNNNRFQVFGDNYLRYGKDGMALVDKDLHELWNVAYQISNPIIAMHGESLVVGDRNGNQIIVADKHGVKGEIYTNLPIEKISVSNQGIVLAQVKDGTSSQVICYDSVGTVLMEHQVSINVLGYPLDAAISYDGKKITVSYLQYTGGTLVGNYVSYSLGDMDAVGADRIITQGSVKGTVFPTTCFLDKNTSVVIGDDRLLFTDISSKGVAKEILLDSEIDSLVYNEEYIALCAKSNDGSNETRLLIYNANATRLCDVIFEGAYTNIKIVDKMVILYEGEQCKIFTVSGAEVFAGEYSAEIVDMFPVSNFNKYLIIGKDDIVDVRLMR